MMNEMVQNGCVQNVMPDFEELMKLTEDGSKEKIREQEITKIREIHSRQDKRDTQRTKRIVQRRLGRQWSWLKNLDETYRMPSLLTWRC